MKYRKEMISRLCGRMSATLKRCEPEVPKHLRLMAVRLLREHFTRGLQGETEIYPGMAKMASWGGVKERQARTNVRTLEAWGFMQPVAYTKGGKRATRFWIDPEALIRSTMLLGGNPSPALMAEIRDVSEVVRGAQNPASNPAQYPARNPANNPALVPPVYCKGPDGSTRHKPVNKGALPGGGQ